MVRLLQRAIESPGMSLGLAPRLVDHHIHRNEVARRAYAKTWWARHKRAILLLLYN
jgi:hypothetical protein